MANLDPAAAFARLAGGCARVRGAERPEEVLEIVAEEARVLAGGTHAWAARVENGRIVALHRASDPSAAAGDVDAPPLASMLADARPVVRSGGFLGAALRGAGPTSAPEGILALSTESGASSADDAVLEIALGQLATVAGLALEAARLRARADTVTRAREVLLASVSHDLRNPLNTFTMSAGLLRDDLERNDVDATRGISLVSRMERATARMQGLIEDLAEASRLDARRIDFAVREERAGQLVKDAVAAAAARAATERGATVACDTIDDEARVMVDRARTLQLISKIIAFEAKCTGEDGTIHLGVARQGDSVLFTARAIGPGGMLVSPPEEGRGGLALLIARGLAEAQRGTLRIEPGEGLVVALTLPGAKT